MPEQQQAKPACTGDCVIQTVLTEGICKEEFLVSTHLYFVARVSQIGGWVDQWEYLLLQAFDSCFDAAHANGGDEEACTPLVGACHAHECNHVDST
jgi:hypothetical protein